MTKHNRRSAVRLIAGFLFLLLTITCLSGLTRAGALTPATKVSGAYQSSEYYTKLTGVTLTGHYSTDLVNVALSQVGYHEGNAKSEYGGGNTAGWRNRTEYGTMFSVDDSWCAMFVSWCARQAQIPATVINNAARATIDDGYSTFHVPYQSPASYTPKAGDLIFFKHPDNHVGIVAAVEDGRVMTIEGNSNNAVRVWSYSLTNKQIWGYGVYSQAAEQEASDFDSSELIHISIPSGQGVFGPYPDGDGNYSASSMYALLGRKATVNSNLYIRSGYALHGYYLYRTEDEKWLTDDGWQTGQDTARKGLLRVLFENGVTVIPDDTWREGCEEAGEFTLCPVWRNLKTWEALPDTGAPGVGFIDSEGEYRPWADIDPDAWYYADVMFALEKKLLDPVSEYCFGIGRPVTRAMFVTALYRAAGEPQPKGTALPFDDVGYGASYYNAVEWAYTEGVTMGVSETSFAPEKQLTRQEYIVLLTRYAYDAAADPGDTGFRFKDDGKIALWARQDIYKAYRTGLVNGVLRYDGLYAAPDTKITTEQASAVLRRLLDVGK